MEDRKVFFLDDQQRKEHNIIDRLHRELQSRRAELNALDLAVVKQKSELKRMKLTEKLLMSEKQCADAELSQLQEENQENNLPRSQRRR